jgi:ATP synthase protein I
MSQSGQEPSESTPPKRKPAQPRTGSEGEVWTIISYLLSGMLVWGGGGWVLDRWLGTTFFIPMGLLIGTAASLYLVWLRYGRQ